jgi:hypothetical protein
MVVDGHYESVGRDEASVEVGKRLAAGQYSALCSPRIVKLFVVARITSTGLNLKRRLERSRWEI